MDCRTCKWRQVAARSLPRQTVQAWCAQADICQLGMDQRKVNVLAREYCDKIKRKLKPVILSHEMLPGLLEVGHPLQGSSGACMQLTMSSSFGVLNSNYAGIP